MYTCVPLSLHSHKANIYLIKISYTRSWQVPKFAKPCYRETDIFEELLPLFRVGLHGLKMC